MDARHQDNPRRSSGWRLTGRTVAVSLLSTAVLSSAALGVAHAGTGSLRTSQQVAMADATSTETASPTPTPTPAPTPAPTPTPVPNPSTAASDLTVVQANVESPQSVSGFQADSRTVFAQGPDLITWNEVAFRQDVFLAPPGYALWRTPGQYTGATPVAWRTDQWIPVAQGTYMISDKGGIPPRKETELGLRNANWVTLSGVDGRTLSLVSVHIAPNVEGWADLRRSSVRRLTGLVGQLDDHGPVIVGGDFNMFHLGSGYPKDLFDAAGMVPTYDMLGTRFPTYDKGGAIIDYLFVAGGQLAADVHYPVELNSDHDALVAGFSWTTDAPNTVSKVISNPDGTAAERRAVAKAVNQAVADAAKGEHLWLATAKFDYGLIYRSLVRAANRGVKVHYVTRSKELTTHELKLRRALEGKRGSQVEVCGTRCAEKWRAKDRPTTTLLVTSPTRNPRLRVDVSRYLRENIITRPTEATISTGYTALTEAKGFFAKYE